ncbi:MAG: TetR/AcrR family transcriptional regulator [Verrucomicrobiota bacterium]|jgi:AcrR family transcriptional regulator|nr:TetR/AcrR family transcriptional regulator [Verrucomicrobiota bacterium]MDP7049858.1 TetR/AcrR family transcriptional regulator [Verrucomicrobiota bacterium]
MAKRDTKSRILDTAERLFARSGFDAVSLRNIIAAAKVNLAAVHYHFGSKQALVHAVIARRLRPINEERLAKLAEARAKAGRRPLQLEHVLDCLFRPLFRVQADPKAGPTFGRLVGRVMGERNVGLHKFMMSELAEVIIQFRTAFEAALPGLPREEADWRSHFMAGAMAHTLCNADLLARFTGTDADASDYESTVRRLIDFTAAGFRARVSPPPKNARAKRKPKRT